MLRILITSIFLYCFSLSSLVSAMTMQFSLMGVDHTMMNMSYGNDSLGEEKETQNTQQTEDSSKQCIQHCLSEMGIGVFAYTYFSVNDKEKIHNKNHFLTQTTTLYHRSSIPTLNEDSDNQLRKKNIQQFQSIQRETLSPYEHYVGTTLLTL